MRPDTINEAMDLLLHRIKQFKSSMAQEFRRLADKMTIYQAESTDPEFKTFRCLSEHRIREHLANYLEAIAEYLDPNKIRWECWNRAEPETPAEYVIEAARRMGEGPTDTVTALGHTYQILSPMDPESPDELKRLTLADYLGYPVEDVTCSDVDRSEYQCDGETSIVIEDSGTTAKIILRLDHNRDAWSSFRGYLICKIP